MKRHLSWLAVLAAMLAPAAAAEDPPPGAERVRRFRQDRPLIAALVRDGLRLAAEESPLQRAACCTEAARRLAVEIRQAAAHQDKDRVAELGPCLNALLREGVATNLSAARQQIPLGSTLEKSLQDLRDRAAELLRPLEEQLQQAADAAGREAFEHTLKALRDGRTEVENAAEVRSELRRDGGG